MSYQARARPFSEWQDGEPALLTRDDLDVVLGLLAEMAPSWSAELNQASPDESTIVVLPEGANDLIGPAFVLCREGGRVRLDQFRWDEYRKLGAFRCLDDALAAMRARLVPLVARREPDFDDGA
jgi:hypothetical protein